MRPALRRKLYMTGSRSDALDMARGRLVIIGAVFVIFYLVLMVRAFDLSVLQGYLQNPEDRIAQQEKAQAGPDKILRGDIVDRNGVLLARSIKTTSLYADPKMIQEPEQAARDLHEVFPDITYGDALQKLQSNSRFVWIKRNITPEDNYKILQLGYPGLNFKTETRRVYPHANLAAHMLGYTNIDGDGLAGIENAFNSFLKDSGKVLRLSLDMRIQHALRKSVADAMTKHQAIGAAGIVMDVTNGEVIAAVSMPDFDPHNAGSEKDDKKFNRYSLGVYEPGSTFKIFSTAAYLDIVGGDLAQTFDARNPIEVGRFTINDYHAEKRIMTIPEIFMHSSNIGSALMGEKIGTERLKSFYEDLGLLDTAEIEIPEKGAPLVPDPWREVNTLTASFGHGIAISPLQLVAAASSIMNGGLYVKPTFILPQNDLTGAEKKEGLRIVSPQTAHRMRQLMRLVVTDGTGSKADVKGYGVGGKTGTAEKIGPNGYDKKKLVSSFLGVYPSHEPHYAVYVMVDEPKGTKDTFGYATGGWVAAPAVRETIEKMVAILGIAPDENEEDISEPLRSYVKTKEQIEKERKAHLASY